MLVEECYTTPAVIGSEGISLNGCSCCQTFFRWFRKLSVLEGIIN